MRAVAALTGTVFTIYLASSASYAFTGPTAPELRRELRANQVLPSKPWKTAKPCDHDFRSALVAPLALLCLTAAAALRRARNVTCHAQGRDLHEKNKTGTPDTMTPLSGRVLGTILQPVRMWNPDKIPVTERRDPADRVRIHIKSPMSAWLHESYEIIKDFMEGIGGEVDGPWPQPIALTSYADVKGKKGKGRSRYEYRYIFLWWTMDVYPPAEGGLEALMSLRLPHYVKCEID